MNLLKPLKIPSLKWRDPEPIDQSRIDYYTSENNLIKYKKDMYKKLRMMNYASVW